MAIHDKASRNLIVRHMRRDKSCYEAAVAEGLLEPVGGKGNSKVYRDNYDQIFKKVDRDNTNKGK